MRGLTSRLLVFNLLLAVFPIGAVLFMGTYESQLLESQERAMVQQGRLLASALAGTDLSAGAAEIFTQLGGRTDARLRVVDSSGRLLADSASPGAEEAVTDSTVSKSADSTEYVSANVNYPEENLIYRIGALPARLFRRVLGFFRPPVAPQREAEYYSGRDLLDGPEIQAALEGRYGAATRISNRQKSVTLYSAIPIRQGDSITGAVLVSRSTFAILSDLYQLRLNNATIFLLSVGGAVLLSLLLSRTVTVPVGRLRDQAESLLDERGKLLARFRPFSGRDEVAGLSRALYNLSARLEQRSEHMEDFMADLVHEMKNPIAGILSASELAMAGNDPQRFLQVIDREGRRMQRLLDDLRELISVDMRLDAGQQDKVDTATILSSLTAAYPGKDKIRFTDLTNGPVYVAANPDRLAQAVLNLLDNSVSFSPPRTPVDLVLEAPSDGSIVIRVADQGPGIPSEMTEKVFERWYTDRPVHEASDHTGLGLAIVRGIAEGYNGQVNIVPGSGTVIELEFPAEG